MKTNKKTREVAPPLKAARDKGSLSSYRRIYNKIFNTEFRQGWLFVLLALVCLLAFSIKIRYDEYRAWQKEPQRYFAKADMPLMTTHDAYYWLRVAREYRDGTIDKILYPDITEVPLISIVAAKLSWFFNNSLHKTAIFLTLLLPGLFVIPLFLYFHKIGSPPSGVLGSLIGTATLPYLTRTCLGSFDTDLMNLFFPFLASFFILLTNNRDKKYTYIYAALTGLTMLVFYWWYDKAGFTTIYFFVLLGYLIAHRIEKKTLLYSALIYTLFANPIHLWNGFSYIVWFIKYYVISLAYAGELVFPKVVKTISEASHLSFVDLLSWILRPGLLSLTGLVSFIGFSVFKWKKLIPLIPIFSLGVLSFVSSNRLAMYLAPFVGVGYGFMLSAVFNKIFSKTGVTRLLKVVAVYSLSFLVFFLITLKTTIFFIPQPAISAAVYRAFMDFKDRLPKGSVIVSWWDFGYALQDATGHDVLLNGSGRQNEVTTNLLARGLITDSQRELYNILSLVTRKDKELDSLLNSAKTHTELIAALKTYNSRPDSDNIYLLFTEDMVGLTTLDKYISIQTLGTWGAASAQKSFGSNLLNCQTAGPNNSMMKCNDNVFDPVNGLLNGYIPAKKTILVKDGYIYTENRHNRKEGVYVELLGRKVNNVLNIAAIKVLPEEDYNTNINQMFLLGNYDRELFEEVYMSLPDVRLFRVKVKK